MGAFKDNMSPFKIKSSTSKYPRKMSFEYGLQVELKTKQ